jgi:hypothetical protein
MEMPNGPGSRMPLLFRSNVRRMYDGPEIMDVKGGQLESVCLDVCGCGCEWRYE